MENGLYLLKTVQENNQIYNKCSNTNQTAKRLRHKRSQILIVYRINING
jgi:hypothetical protein